MMTIMQRHLCDLIKDCSALRLSQLIRYAYLKFGASSKRTKTEIHQLHVLGKVRIDGEIVSHPEKTPDNDMLDAFDILLTLCQTEPEVSVGMDGSYKLLFFMQENGGALQAFKVVVVKNKGEEVLAAKLENDIYPKGHIILFLEIT